VIRRFIRPRRLIEATLVLFIVVAYLLVVTRGQIVTTLAGAPNPYPTAPAVTHSTAPTGDHTP
jgi:hypothetical protein